MNKLIVALIAGTFAAVASAQAPAPQAPAAPATPAPKMSTKEKAATVDAATKVGDNTTGAAADAKGAAAAKAEKGTPKALPTKADKQKAVDETTKSQAKGG
jgi:cytoskeletal protein RodZ